MTPLKTSFENLNKFQHRYYFHYLFPFEHTMHKYSKYHDELLLLVKEDIADEWAQILKTTMEKAEAKWLGEIPALAEVSIGDRWSEVH